MWDVDVGRRGRTQMQGADVVCRRKTQMRSMDVGGIDAARRCGVQAWDVGVGCGCGTWKKGAEVERRCSGAGGRGAWRAIYLFRPELDRDSLVGTRVFSRRGPAKPASGGAERVFFENSSTCES